MTYVHYRSRRCSSFLQGAGAAVALVCLAVAQPPTCHAQIVTHRGKADVNKTNLSPGTPVNIDSPTSATVSFALPDPAQGSVQRPRLLAPVIINAALNAFILNLPPGTRVIVRAKGDVHITFAAGPPPVHPGKMSITNSLNVSVANLPPGTPTSVVSRLDVTISFAPGMPSAKPGNLYIKNGLNARVDNFPPGTPVIIHSGGDVSLVWALPAPQAGSIDPPMFPASVLILSKANVSLSHMPLGTGPVYTVGGGGMNQN